MSDYEAFQAAVEPVTVADKERKKAAEKWDKEHTYGSFTEPSGPGSEPYEMLNQFRTGWNKHMSKNENHIHNIVKEAISRVLKEKY